MFPFCLNKTVPTALMIFLMNGLVMMRRMMMIVKFLMMQRVKALNLIHERRLALFCFAEYVDVKTGEQPLASLHIIKNRLFST
jgi:hypothetical protein